MASTFRPPICRHFCHAWGMLPHTAMSAPSISLPAPGRTTAGRGPAAPATLSPGMFPPLAASRQARSLRSDAPTLAPVRTSPPAPTPRHRFHSAAPRPPLLSVPCARAVGCGGGVYYFWIILASKPPAAPSAPVQGGCTTFEIIHMGTPLGACRCCHQAACPEADLDCRRHYRCCVMIVIIASKVALHSVPVVGLFKHSVENFLILSVLDSAPMLL